MNFSTNKKPYAEKLLDPRWQKIKNSIQIRDQFTCQKCRSREKTLHVHHRHYLTGREPWDYPENLLVLLCSDCHLEEENAKLTSREVLDSLHYWGYFNTEIIAELNKLIEAKLQSQKPINGNI